MAGSIGLAARTGSGVNTMPLLANPMDQPSSNFAIALSGMAFDRAVEAYGNDVPAIGSPTDLADDLSVTNNYQSSDWGQILIGREGENLTIGGIGREMTATDANDSVPFGCPVGNQYRDRPLVGMLTSGSSGVAWSQTHWI